MQIAVGWLGPVAKLDQHLSKHAQNLVYARNGTGKSFLTRALLCMDHVGQGRDIPDAARLLVAEESADGLGSFSLSQGAAKLASLNLDLKSHEAKADCHGRLFHVFSDDFIHSELRQCDYVVNGQIESEIAIDQTHIDTRDADSKLRQAETAVGIARAKLTETLESDKEQDLIQKAGINRRLKDFLDVEIDQMLELTDQPDAPRRAFREVLADLDLLKSVPAEPDYPTGITSPGIAESDLSEAKFLFEQVVSPSTVAEHIKEQLSRNDQFIRDGLNIHRLRPEDGCPFCHQSVDHPPASDLLTAYVAYFADAEGVHKSRLRESWKAFKACRDAVSQSAGKAAREIVKYENLRQLVASQRTSAIPNLEEIASRTDAALAAYLVAIEKKGKTPTEAVAIPTSDPAGDLEELRITFGELNGLFENLAGAIRASDSERKALQREACKAFRDGFVRSHWSEISSYHDLTSKEREARNALQDLKNAAQPARTRDRVARTFKALISNFFGTKYTFDQDEFVLKRANKNMVRGPARTLSDGEKTAIAFCYFIACMHKKVRRNDDYDKLFLVFDDPITSMSYDFVFTIAQTLKNLSIRPDGEVSINPADAAKGGRPDLLVFTHSTYFYNICVTNRVVKPDAAFFLYQAGAEHKLARRDKYLAPFGDHLREIVAVFEGRDPDHTTGNAIRCVLEAVGRFCRPDKHELSDFVLFLSGDERFSIKSVLINNLSHGSYYDEVPSPDEMREACGEVVQVVKHFAEGQLELIKAIDAKA